MNHLENSTLGLPASWMNPTEHLHARNNVPPGGNMKCPLSSSERPEKEMLAQYLAFQP